MSFPVAAGHKMCYLTKEYFTSSLYPVRFPQNNVHPSPSEQTEKMPQTYVDKEVCFLNLKILRMFEKPFFQHAKNVVFEHNQRCVSKT